jgi:L-iditol 2-dehydrogenase
MTLSTTSGATTMLAVRLHGPRDLRLDEVPHPGAPGPGEALLRITAVGICGSDLHTYKDARIGDTSLEAPLTLGHEFAGVVEAVGSGAESGAFTPLQPGTRVAVDPAQPCGRCELCEQGHPNLCRRLHFCGLYPDEGALSGWLRVPARTCFPLPAGIDDAGGALLEPLGVAIHATDLARIRVGDSAALLGAGPIGLCLLQTLRLAGADPIFVSDRLPWRLELAERLGGVAVDLEAGDPVASVLAATEGRGVDVAVEAAWADRSVQQAADMTRLGGRMVLVGIPEDDRLQLRHASVRRKGLTIRLSRRMKHAYPRAIRLVESGRVDLEALISHRFPLDRAPEAFALNVAYRDRVNKIVIDVSHA